jgi:phosphate transport system ATP-binding protein
MTFAPPSPVTLNMPVLNTSTLPTVAANTGVMPAVPESSASSLVASDVSAWFGARKVLERCSLNMQAGQVTALIGPSGCGKSTFLRTLNRMHEVIKGARFGGRIELDGEDIYGDTMGTTQVRLQIGMVFQKPNPFPALSIRDNVLAGLKLAGMRHDNPDGLVEQCLTRAGLWNEVKDEPKVLLMDEPCSALDPISTRVVEETIGELHRDITIVIVTHNMQQAQRVSHRCAFFLVEEQGEPGRIVEAGPTAMLFSSPSDQRTLDYVTGRFG